MNTLRVWKQSAEDKKNQPRCRYAEQYAWFMQLRDHNGDVLMGEWIRREDETDAGFDFEARRAKRIAAIKAKIARLDAERAKLEADIRALASEVTVEVMTK